jgi:hypothetical protein
MRLENLAQLAAVVLALAALVGALGLTAGVWLTLQESAAVVVDAFAATERPPME